MKDEEPKMRSDYDFALFQFKDVSTKKQSKKSKIFVFKGKPEEKCFSRLEFSAKSKNAIRLALVELFKFRLGHLHKKNVRENQKFISFEPN